MYLNSYEGRMEQEYTVEFQVTMRAKVKCKPEDVSDAVSDIDIPESEDVEYVSDTFEVLSVVDKDGKTVETE